MCPVPPLLPRRRHHRLLSGSSATTDAGFLAASAVWSKQRRSQSRYRRPALPLPAPASGQQAVRCPDPARRQAQMLPGCPKPCSCIYALTALNLAGSSRERMPNRRLSPLLSMPQHPAPTAGAQRSQILNALLYSQHWYAVTRLKRVDLKTVGGSADSFEQLSSC